MDIIQDIDIIGKWSIGPKIAYITFFSPSIFPEFQRVTMIPRFPSAILDREKMGFLNNQQRIL